MRVIGVIDLLAGRAVHARGGVRERYEPVAAVAGSFIAAGSADALARAYVDRLGVAEIYVADLDAILGRTPQDALVRELSTAGVPLWLDAGIATADRARHVVGLGAAHVIVGLETLDSYASLDAICAGLGAGQVAFSLDLRAGQPVATARGLPAASAESAAARAAEGGVGAIIVLDLARVGTASGADVATIARVRRAVPHVTLLAGGGVRHAEDLRQLADAGCDGALVATALHTGALRILDS
jgi:phosphoribosylformimino-5-aminoimidazole carboxamide ribotide isomerase